MKSINIKNTATALVVTATALSFQSCDKGFADMNVNPNTVASADEGHLFAGRALSIFTERGNDRGLGTAFIDRWFQFGTSQSGDARATVTLMPTTSLGMWDHTYGNVMGAIVELQRQIDGRPAEVKEQLANMAAYLRIIKAYQFHRLTDYFGDIPYFDALKGSLPGGSVLEPAYDSQRAIYEDILKELTEAKASFRDPATQRDFAKYDLFFGGDQNKWRRFVNSLKLRIGLRFVKVDADWGRQIVQQALTDPDGVMQSNADGLRQIFPAQGLTAQAGMGSLMASSTMIRFLEDHQDPRLRLFFEKNDYSEAVCNILGITYDPNKSRYVGAPASPDAANTSNLFRLRNPAQNIYDTLSRVSRKLFNPRTVTASTLASRSMDVLFSYAEVLFLKAEAAERGWYGGETAKNLYEQGVRASLDQWFERASFVSPMILPTVGTIQDFSPMTQAEKDNYLTMPDIAYDPNKGLEQIIVQSMLNNFSNSHLIWADWRRTGIPNQSTIYALEPYRGGGEELEIPRRYPYSSSEEAHNPTVYKAKIASFPNGVDDPYIRVWWDKE